MQKHKVKALVLLNALGEKKKFKLKVKAFSEWKMCVFLKEAQRAAKVERHNHESALEEIKTKQEQLQQLYLYQNAQKELTMSARGVQTEDSNSLNEEVSVQTGKSYLIQKEQLYALMNPYFLKNQHALPKSLQSLVHSEQERLTLSRHLKSNCLDLLSKLLDE